MKLPGFSAEASLQRPAAPYRTTEMSVQASDSIHPSYFLHPGLGLLSCFGRCLGTCPRNPLGQVDRYCRYICAEQCGGAPYIPSVQALNF